MLIRSVFAVALLAALPLFPLPAFAEDEPKPIAPTLQPFVDSHVLAGAVTLVASRDKVLDLSTVGYADVAAKLSRALGRGVSYVDVPDDAVRGALLGAGLSDWFAGALVGLYQDYRRSGTDGYAAQVTDTVTRLTGRPARSLDDLLAEIPA